ncbi:hypothetical protein [Pseudoflavonifractor sp. 524-17]|uniref:hypothetical protein n=1 Tax=Pseudoflavonifractor sp. 524-17 TaxID=2304577 RepID=UPI001FAD38DA|nr:hypothetical protein [Pseudoflavonifractor sp. 524-17]
MLGIENVVGFDASTVYRTYDDFVNDSERKYIEYFMRDLYVYYGYNFHYYSGEEMNSEQIRTLIDDFTTLDIYVRKAWENMYEDAKILINGETVPEEEAQRVRKKMLDDRLKDYHNNRVEVTDILIRKGLRFVNKHGQPLRMMRKLELDPVLLEQPLYR